MRNVEAQLLHRPAGMGPGEVVRHLLGIQAQDVSAAHLAFRARSSTIARSDIEQAVETREIVRAWGPRGTLHYIHHDDLPWLLALTARRTGTLRRLAEEGVRGDDLLQLIDRALAGQGPLTKAQLEQRLAGRAHGQGIVHLVALAAFHGLAVLGPMRAGKPTYVHTADWLGRPIIFDPDRDRALAELAARYRRSHAPATPEDLAAWSGLPLGDTRSAWQRAEQQTGPDEAETRGEGEPARDSGDATAGTRAEGEPTRDSAEAAAGARGEGASMRDPDEAETWGEGEPARDSGEAAAGVRGEGEPTRDSAEVAAGARGRGPRDSGEVVAERRLGKAASESAVARGQTEHLVRLLPAFDEYLMGWKSRDPILAPEHARKVLPGGGILRPTVLVDGVIRGTWTRRGSTVTVEPFEELPALDDEIEDIRRFFA